MRLSGQGLRMDVATPNPIQQGLKHVRGAEGGNVRSVATPNPIQQGLKHGNRQSVPLASVSRNTQSNTTRIETRIRHLRCRPGQAGRNTQSNTTRIETPIGPMRSMTRSTVATPNPIQQGLKRVRSGRWCDNDSVATPNPIQQGLKHQLGIARGALGFESQHPIQYNKD